MKITIKFLLFSQLTLLTFFYQYQSNTRFSPQIILLYKPKEAWCDRPKPWCDMLPSSTSVFVCFRQSLLICSSLLIRRQYLLLPQLESHPTTQTTKQNQPFNSPKSNFEIQIPRDFPSKATLRNARRAVQRPTSTLR